MRILFLGDIVGRAGRSAVLETVQKLRKEFKAEVCVANGENAAGGFGLTRAHAETLLLAGVDVFTTGNHVWSKKEIIPLMDTMPILRPHNLPSGDPGSGVYLYKTDAGETLCIINLIGRLYMELPAESPFDTLDAVLKTVETPHILVDFHAEATSEKKALGYFADGRISALCGTHTHVQTADETILPHGTAYITDVGMCGATDSVLGASVEIAVQRFLTSVRKPYSVAEGPHRTCGLFIETDAGGKAVRVERICV